MTPQVRAALRVMPAKPGVYIFRSHTGRALYIGRAGDLTRLERLCSARVPIITLWGPPGIGKTRLAIELCGRLRGPVWFCDLSAARDTADICYSVLRALSSAAPSAHATPAWIGTVLSGRDHGLLVRL